MPQFNTGDVLQAGSLNQFSAINLSGGSWGAVFFKASGTDGGVLQPGTVGQVLLTSGAGVDPFWGVAGAGSQIVKTSAIEAYTSASYVNISGLSLTFWKQLAATSLYVDAQVHMQKITAGAGFGAIAIDGTKKCEDYTLVDQPTNFKLNWLEKGLAAGSHTIAVQVKSSDGNTVRINDGTDSVLRVFEGAP